MKFEVENLIMLGFIRVEEEVVGLTENDEEVTRRVYRLTPKGKDTAKKHSEKLPKEIKNALRSLKRFNEMPLKKLNDYCWIMYGKPHKPLPLYILEENVKEAR
ncbi:hypothetical protein ES702_02494 [subsurface metagenome]